MQQESESDINSESQPIEQAGSPSPGSETPPVQPSANPLDTLNRLPQSQEEQVIGFLAASAQVSGPLAHPLLSKIGPEHITQVIGLRSKTIELTADDRKHSRLFNFLGLALLVIASLSLMLVLALINENDLLLEIVKLGGVGLGGFGGGYGFSALRRRN